MKWSIYWKNKVWKSDSGWVITCTHSCTLGGSLPPSKHYCIFQSHKHWDKGQNIHSIWPKLNKKTNTYYKVGVRDAKKWVLEYVKSNKKES